MAQSLSLTTTACPEGVMLHGELPPHCVWHVLFRREASQDPQLTSPPLWQMLPIPETNALERSTEAGSFSFCDADVVAGVEYIYRLEAGQGAGGANISALASAVWET